MKKQPTDFVELAERLRAFILAAGWVQTRSARGLQFFSPPQALGIRGKYTIALPEDAAKPSVSGLIHDAANSLTQIYGYSQIGDLLDSAASLNDLDRPARIISRFLDETTRGGAIPLSALAAYATKMEETLYRTAKFKLDSDSKSADAAARRFAKECMFLQTAIGSFVAKLEVPSTVLRQQDLFGEPQVDSASVVSSLFSAVSFINEHILGSDRPFEEDETLANVIALFDVELLAAVADVLLSPSMQSIELSFEVGTRIRVTSTGWMSLEKRIRLKEFVAFVKDRLRGENEIDVVGTIVELRSRDPSGNKNHIKVSADFHGDRTFITATLTNIQYQAALDAHRSKRTVRLLGDGVRLATQIRISRLDLFE